MLRIMLRIMLLLVQYFHTMLHLLRGIFNMLGLPYRISSKPTSLWRILIGRLVRSLTLSCIWHVFWMLPNDLAISERRRRGPLCCRLCPTTHLEWRLERDHVTERMLPRLVLFPVHLVSSQKPLPDFLKLPVF
jgi:hypothetical protein